MLVRSLAQKWALKSVVAVDAGTLLAGIARSLDSCSSVELGEKGRAIQITDGPFAELVLPNRSSIANATYTLQELIDNILVSHPHLDHTSALALNSPAAKFQHGRISIAALPSVIAALKNHMFNGIMWPNLSDEDGGVGLVTYRRLTDGGNVMLGSGGSSGYSQVCHGLVVKCMSVAHGDSSLRFHQETGRHHRLESGVFTPEYFARFAPPHQVPLPEHSTLAQRRASTGGEPSARRGEQDTRPASTESSAFFLRDVVSGEEILVFGDVEPDRVSKEDRNWKVWEVAAPKIVAGRLRAIFIECSYTDATPDHLLFGHLASRHVVEELESLARKVRDASKRPESGESQAVGEESKVVTGQSQAVGGGGATSESQAAGPASPKRKASSKGRAKRGTRAAAAGSAVPVSSESSEPPLEEGKGGDNGDNDDRLPLYGLQVYIIHVKDALADGPDPRSVILEQLRNHSQKAGLGCEFYAPVGGESVTI